MPVRRNGITVLDWMSVTDRIIAPAPLAGLDLDNMCNWLESRDPASRDSDLFHVTRERTSRGFTGRRTS
jgi:hypothetical protein